MSGDNLFTPKPAGTVFITSAGTSVSASLNRLGCRQVRIKNLDDTDLAYVNFGDSTVAASAASSMPIGVGETVGITLAEAWTHAAVISTGAIVAFTPGNGL